MRANISSILHYCKNKPQVKGKMQISRKKIAAEPPKLLQDKHLSLREGLDWADFSKKGKK